MVGFFSALEKFSGAMRKLGWLLILIGLIAFVFPLGFGKITVFVLGLFLVAGGFLRLMFAIFSPSLGSLLLRYLFGVLMVIAGIWLLLHLNAGLATLTLVLAIYFLIDGISSIVYSISLFPIGGGSFMLLNGILSILIALLIWTHWPESSHYAFGIYVGIKLLIDGTVLLLLSKVMDIPEITEDCRISHEWSLGNMNGFQKRLVFVLFFSLWMVLSAEVLAKGGGFKEVFVDTLDGHPDLSEFLRTRYGFAFVPILVTEPAVGYGGGGGLVFVHRDPAEIAQGGGVYPSVTGVGGFYTETNSWAIGAGHLGIWKNGRLRYRSGAAYGSFNLHYYREPILPGGIRRVGFNIVAYGFVQELVAQLGHSHFFAGASYTFGRTTVDFDVPVKLPEILSDELDSRIGGLGAVLYFDNRDNMFTPNSGMYAGLKYIYNDTWLGSKKRFHQLFSYWLIYQKLHPNLLGALRLDFQSSSDGTPFYLRPFISLRGVPAMRYQGKTTYLTEMELRWDFTYRWSLVGFGGYGEALPINKDLFEKQSAYNMGAGFRYLIARLYGLRMGVDVARGPEDWAFYIQFGNAWFRY